MRFLLVVTLFVAMASTALASSNAPGSPKPASAKSLKPAKPTKPTKVVTASPSNSPPQSPRNSAKETKPASAGDAPAGTDKTIKLTINGKEEAQIPVSYIHDIGFAKDMYSDLGVDTKEAIEDVAVKNGIPLDLLKPEALKLTVKLLDVLLKDGSEGRKHLDALNAAKTPFDLLKLNGATPEAIEASPELKSLNGFYQAGLKVIKPLTHRELIDMEVVVNVLDIQTVLHVCSKAIADRIRDAVDLEKDNAKLVEHIQKHFEDTTEKEPKGDDSESPKVTSSGVPVPEGPAASNKGKAPKKEKPMTEKPTTDKPKKEKLMTKKPTTDKPKKEKPMTKKGDTKADK